MWIKTKRAWLATNGKHGERDGDGYISTIEVTAFKGRNPDKRPELRGMLFARDFFDGIPVVDNKQLILPVWFQNIVNEGTDQRFAFNSQAVLAINLRPEAGNDFKDIYVEKGMADVVKFDHDMVTIVMDGGDTVYSIPVRLTQSDKDSPDSCGC